MSVHGRQFTERHVPFTAGDGLECNLIHVRGSTPATKGPVVLVHGAGVRANIFRAPVETNVVDYLVENGYDVWLENWRASIDLKPCEWTLDQAALFDHPKAVEKILEETGATSVKAIIHCQGSTSFALAALAGLLPQVDTIVSNAVSLHPVVPRWSWFKLTFVIPLVGLFTKYLDPQWDDKTTDGFIARFLYRFSQLTHHECDNSVCHQVSFYYGSGFPALWSHENLNAETHEWLREEFAKVPLTFYKQITRSIHRGNLVTADHSDKFPDDLCAEPPATSARFALFAGSDNQCFSAESQVKTHAFLRRFNKDHSLHIIPNYGHLDIFMGKNAATDVFPKILAELER